MYKLDSLFCEQERGFPLKSTQMGKWDLSQGNGTAYKSSFMQSVLLYGRQKEPGNLYLPATQTSKDLNILCNNKPP